jgi:general transcription factor 3C polypeptide 2
MKFLSLPRIANDVPATGRPFARTKTQGVVNYQLSEYLIWSVSASEPTSVFQYHVSHSHCPYPAQWYWVPSSKVPM